MPFGSFLNILNYSFYRIHSSLYLFEHVEHMCYNFCNTFSDNSHICNLCFFKISYSLSYGSYFPLMVLSLEPQRVLSVVPHGAGQCLCFSPKQAYQFHVVS